MKPSGVLAAMALLLPGVVLFGAVPQPLFRDVAPDTLRGFSHVNGAGGAFHLPEIMGAGGALLDYDMDGDLDVFLVQGGSLAPPPAGVAHRLFRNDGVTSGRLRFTDVTDAMGIRGAAYGMGVAVGDYDNDGYPDIYVTAFGANQLFRNRRGTGFEDVTASAGAGLDDRRWSSSASFADYDADGDLDLFVANYVDFTVAGQKVCHDPAGARDYCGPLQFRPLPDRLFRNDGSGTFTDVSDRSGISAGLGAGLGVVAADLTGDGRMDFYVANDAGGNDLWVNRGDGTFEDQGLEAGVAFNMDGQPEGSMGIAAGDVDGDGRLDLFVSNISGETHAFYRALGPGQFEDRRIVSRLGPLTAGRTGFGADWFDYDHDGLLDLFVANGAVARREAVRGDRAPYGQRNQLFRGSGAGQFTEMTDQAGPDFDRKAVGRGAAFGDVDNDGDVDVLVTNNGGPPALLLNQVGAAHPSLKIRLVGVTANRAGIGARVGVRRADQGMLWRHVHSDGSYLSASDPTVHVGLSRTPALQAVVVEWPGGMREEWSGLGASGSVELRQGTGRIVPTRPRATLVEK